MTSLLVTGGAGFIGANFVHFWLQRHPGDRVIVLDALTYAGNLASLEPARERSGFAFVHGDITTPGLAEALLREQQVDVVVHLAAESHVDRSIIGPDAFLETNVIGTHTLLKAARAVGVRRFHHVSTDEVYGSLGPKDPPFTETTSFAPNSPYAASKAAADHLVRAYAHTYGVPITITNCSNNYGPYHFPEKLIPLMLVNALDGRPLPIYGDGLNVRDWLYVEDHCRAIERVLEAGREGETYNVGGRNEWTNLAIVGLLCRRIEEAFAGDASLAARFPACPAAHGRPVADLIRHVADRPGHDRRYAIDATKLEVELGFVPQESFETGIRRTLDWFLANEAWWRGVMSGAYREWIARWYGATEAALPGGPRRQ